MSYVRSFLFITLFGIVSFTSVSARVPLSSGSSATVTTTTSADNEFPTAPTNLTVTVETTPTPKVVVSWTAATDNVGVTRYNVYRNGSFLISPPGIATVFTDSSVIVGQSYMYSIQAGDKAGNNSPRSGTLVIKVAPGEVSQVVSSSSLIVNEMPMSPPTITTYSTNDMGTTSVGAGMPTEVKVTPKINQILLTWKNPKVGSYLRARVNKKMNSPPLSATDGEVIYDGVGETFTDTQNLSSSVSYYYGIYTVSSTFVPSSLVTVSGNILTEPKKEVISPLNIPVPSASSKIILLRTLTRGSVGEDVRSLQKFLNKKGFVIATSDTGSPGKEGTLYGLATQTAVQKYQCDRKIVCAGSIATTGYGMVGKTTRGYINSDQ